MEDEESKQTKAWRWIFTRLRVRGDLEAELAHSLWNGMKAALRITLPDTSSLQTSLLKLTICCNHSHGAFLSGDRGVRMKECLQDWLLERNLEWWESFREDMRCVPTGRVTNPVLSLEELMNSNLIRNKGRFVASLQQIIIFRFPEPNFHGMRFHHFPRA